MPSTVRPRGPLPARVYWTRRLIVLGVPLLLVVVLARILGGSSDGKDEAAGTATQAGAAIEDDRCAERRADRRAGTGKGKKGKKKRKRSRADRAARAGPRRADRPLRRLRHRRDPGHHLGSRRVRHPDHPQPPHRGDGGLHVAGVGADHDRHDHLRRGLHLEHPRVPGRHRGAGPRDPPGRRHPRRGDVVGQALGRDLLGPYGRGRTWGSTTSRRPPSAATRPTSSSRWSPRPPR